MTKYEVTPGKYWYSRPGWRGQVSAVEVAERNGQLCVIFKEGYIPPTVAGCSEDAIFEVRDESTHHLQS